MKLPEELKNKLLLDLDSFILMEDIEAIVRDCAKAENALHIAICRAVTLLNVGDTHPAHRILRVAMMESSTLERYDLEPEDSHD